MTTPSKPEYRRSKSPATGTLMSAKGLLDWFSHAKIGERCLYYRGNLAWARANKFDPGHDDLMQLVNEARRLGTPSDLVVGPLKDRSPDEYGQGRAHLAQKRVAEDLYEYWITKST